MIDPSMTDDRDRVMRIIRARCPELGPDDLALITHPDPARVEPDLPVEIGEQILDVLAEMGDRLDRLADAAGVNKDEDDADAARRGADQG
jgi:hypothetical protein